MIRQLHIVYFAWVRERLGLDGEAFEYAEANLTVAQLVDRLRQIDDAYAEVFADLGKLRFALDQDFVSLDAPLGNARELAIFPPVTGG